MNDCNQRPRRSFTGRAGRKILFILVGLLSLGSLPVYSQDSVILLHGLMRSSASMEKMKAALTFAGYDVINVDYPSRSSTIEALADSVIPAALACVTSAPPGRVHFVTHSMGGILLRQYLAGHRIRSLGRVVMLGPPNQGSEVVDRLGDLELFECLNGPAGHELGTSSNSVPARLGPVDFELGVIAGDRSINWINSLMIPGSDDGKVSVERTRVQGMRDHVVIHVSHPFIMRDDAVIAETIRFLREGKFRRE